MSTTGTSTPSLKRSTEKTTLTLRAARSVKAARRSSSGVSDQTATDGMLASLKTRAMNRAWAMFTQKPRVRMVRMSSTRSMSLAITCFAQASLAVRSLDRPSAS